MGKKGGGALWGGGHGALASLASDGGGGCLFCIGVTIDSNDRMSPENPLLCDFFLLPFYGIWCHGTMLRFGQELR